MKEPRFQAISTPISVPSVKLMNTDVPTRASVQGSSWASTVETGVGK